MANVTEDEQDEIKERYEIFDKVGDGKVESSQILDVLRACGLNPLTAEVEKMVEDSGLKGKRVEISQFTAMYEQIKNRHNQITYEDMMEAFRTFDREQSGSILSAQLRQVLVNMGDTLTEEQADAIIASREDANGYITYQTMIKELMAS